MAHFADLFLSLPPKRERQPSGDSLDFHPAIPDLSAACYHRDGIADALRSAAR